MGENILLKNHENYKVYTTEMEWGRIIVEFVNPVTIELPYGVSFHHCTKIVSDKERTDISFYDKNDNEIVGANMNVSINYRIEYGDAISDAVYSLSELYDLRHKETLKSVFEGEFGKMGLSESELMSFCQYYEVEYFDNIRSLQDDLKYHVCCVDYLWDYIAVDLLAGDFNYTMVNDSLWIENNSFNDFRDLVYEEFDDDIFKAIHQWRKDCQ